MKSIYWYIIILLGLSIYILILVPLYEKFKIILISGKYSKAHRKWLANEEWRFRHINTYPEDWNFRRSEIYYRYKGICQNCNEKIIRYHIHHIISLSKGGNNSLENLILLCEQCHIDVHPNNKLLLINKNRRKFQYLLNKNHGLHKARYDFHCHLCEQIIFAGSKYWGTGTFKICFNCYKNQVK